MSPLRMLPGLFMRGLPGLVDGASRAAVTEFPGPIERSDDRDAALLLVLPLVRQHGWTPAALQLAAGPDADLLFPGGAVEMVEAHADYGDRRMEAAAGEILETRTSRRVRELILLRLRQSEDERDAIRRGLAVLSLPGTRLASLRAIARTVDTIWHVAGDVSVDQSWYSKRAILAAVYSATLLFWLRDETGGLATEAFLDRRLQGVARIGKLKRALSPGWLSSQAA